MRKVVLIFGLLLFPFFTWGQSTSVTATVTDLSGQNWNYGTYQFSFYPSPLNPIGPYVWTGGAFNPSAPISGPLTSTGQIAAVLIPSNSAITPSGSQWTVTVCPAATSTCFSKTITITGASMNLSSVLTPPAPVVNAVGVSQLTAYQDSSIVGAKLGTTYFNLNDNTIHQCTGPTLPCTWVSIAGSSVSLLPLNNTWTGNNTFQGNLSAAAGGTGNVALKPPAAASIMYAATYGLDTNDGLSFGSPKQYIDTAICSLPLGSCTGTVSAGQGTVYFTNGTLANSAATPGIWLACAGDPNFSALPTGWMQGPPGSQALNIEGIPTVNSGPQSTIGKALLGGNASIKVSACSSAINFQNMSIAYPAIDIQIGQCSNGARNNTCPASNIHFKNVAGNVNNVSGNGPAVDLTGASFDVNFEDSSFTGNLAATPTTDQAQPVLIDGRANSGLGDITFNRGTISNGGIRMYPGMGILLNIDVQDMVQEGSFGESLVHIVNDGLSSNPVVTVISPQIADPAASVIPAVTVDPGLNGYGVKVTGAFGQGQNVSGPMNVDTQYAPELATQIPSPIAQNETGFFAGHVVGQDDNLWRLFSPLSVQYPNLCSTSPASWNATYGGAVSTVTSGQGSPDGLTGAGLISYSSGGGNASYTAFCTFGNVPLTLGDYYAWTAVIRSGTNNGYVSGNQPIQFTLNGDGYGNGDQCNTSTGTQSLGNPVGFITGDGEWERIWGICKVTANPTNGGIVLYAQVSSTQSLVVYTPTLIHIAAGSISNNEAFAIASALQVYSSSCIAGQLCTPVGPFNPGTLPTFQVNGTPLSAISVINFQNSAPFNGVTFTETNPSSGNVQLGASGQFTNSALVNPFTTVNGQTCTLGASCNVPFQTNGVNNASMGGVNFSTSTTNAVGLTVTPKNPGTNQETFEITGGAYTGTAAALGATPSDCSGGQFATGIAANGNAICATPSGSGNFLVSGGAQYDIATFSGATSGIGIVPGTTGYSLVSNGASAYPTFQQVSLSTGVTGLLPNSNIQNPSTTVNLATCTLGSSCTANPIIAVTNAGSTGTTLNTLTKVTGAPSTAVIGAITDTSGMVGITVSGAGTTGTATIQTTGQVNCVFSNSTTAGDYVQISPTVAGNCADTGSSTPPGGYSVGRVLSTNGSAGTYQIDLALGTGSSGGSSSFTGMTTNGVAYATSTTGGTSSTAPSINGQYSFGVNVTTGASTTPGFSLIGLTGPTTLTGSVNSYTTTYADNSSVIPHYFASTVSVTLNLSTPTTVLNSFPVYSYSNHSTHIDTIAPAGGFTIQSGNSAAASSINVSPGVECRIMIDPLNSGSNWLADCRPNGGFSTIGFASVTGGTGAGAYLISNSLAPTGAGTVEATQMWNVIGSSTPPSIGQCWVASSATAAAWSGCTGSLAFPLTVSGTVNSGGIPGFTSTTTMASSALLALGHVMLGGGAGATPTTDANFDDGQTLLNQLTYAGTAGIKASQGALVAGLSGGVSQPFVLQQGTAPPSSGAQDRCYGDSTFNWILCSMNNGTYNQLVVSSSTSSTSGDLATYSGIGGNTVQDSTIPGTNLVLAATPAASAKQVCTATANSSKTCSYIDFPEVFEFPTANVNGSNAGNGWSINTTCGPLPSIYARAGTNLATGYLQFSASESACTQFELPADWDTATNPYIRVNYTQNASTASQSIIYTIQIGCSATTDDAAFATAQTFSTTTTGATANTPYTQTLQLNSTSMTACAGGSMMNLKVSTAAGSSAATNLQMVSLTVPRLITVQAN